MSLSWSSLSFCPGPKGATGDNGQRENLGTREQVSEALTQTINLTATASSPFLALSSTGYDAIEYTPGDRFLNIKTEGLYHVTIEDNLGPSTYKTIVITSFASSASMMGQDDPSSMTGSISYLLPGTTTFLSTLVPNAKIAVVNITTSEQDINFKIKPMLTF